MSIYNDMGLSKIINASGKLTALGGSTLDYRVAKSMEKASGEFVQMDELINKSGKIIANYIGAEDVCVTIGAASGIVIAIAAILSYGDLDKIEKLPFLDGSNKNILIQKGHAINFGAPVIQMIRLGGGNPIEVGNVNKVSKYNIENNIDENTKALVYVKSHHCVQKGMVSLEDMIDISYRYNIPLIMDAAAEEDLKVYLEMGVDLIIYSGGKAISGPTSGFIAGKSDLIECCKLQYNGIGRAMKLSKENIVGLIKAVELYFNDSQVGKYEKDKHKMEWLMKEINKINGLKSSIEKDEAGREIYRLKIIVEKESFGTDAKGIVSYLREGNPQIFTRDHYSNIGLIYIDPRQLIEEQEQEILDRFIEISKSPIL